MCEIHLAPSSELKRNKNIGVVFQPQQGHVFWFYIHYLPNEVMFLPLHVRLSVCQQDNSKKLSMRF